MPSGLDVALRVLRRVEEIAFCELTSRDVVRHPLVQKIVKAYEAYEESGNARKAAAEKSRRAPAGRQENNRRERRGARQRVSDKW